MPRYDALVNPSIVWGDYQDVLAAFKKTCARIFSSSEKPLNPSDFYGPAEPRGSHDLPEDAQVVFMLFLDSTGREFSSDERDDIADLVARQVLVHAGVHVRVWLDFSSIGWSFLKEETIANGLTSHLGPETMELFHRFGGGRE